MGYSLMARDMAESAKAVRESVHVLVDMEGYGPVRVVRRPVWRRWLGR